MSTTSNQQQQHKPTAHFKTTLWASRTAPKNNARRAGWRVEKPLIYWSPIAGQIIVEPGFETDFASVPRLPFAFLLFGDRVHAAAVVHDWLVIRLYRVRRMSWRECAVIFHEAMRALGAPFWQRWPMYWAVRFYGLAARKDAS